MNFIYQLLQIIITVITALTFLYVTIGGTLFKKKIVLHSVGAAPVTFKVQRKNYNVQQLTNIVSVLYYQGGQIPPEVRKEIIMLTTPMAFNNVKLENPSQGPHIFVNLSNHPSSNWPVEQKTAAEAFGEIVDMPFPAIPSEADEAAISQLADEYVKKINDLCGEQRPTVHLMGEMNFTYALVSKLRRLNIECVAATTERIVEELPNGEKKSTFKFVRFRRYE